MVGGGENGGSQITAIGAVEVDCFGARRNGITGYTDEVRYGALSRTSRAITLMSPLILRRPDR